MPSSTPKRKLRRLWLILPLTLVLFLFLLNLGLQTFWAHRAPAFHPDYPMVELSPILARDTLDAGDYETLLLQTGLSKTAVDNLLAYGDVGRAQIEATQAGFFTDYDSRCATMLPGRFTCEDLTFNRDGERTAALPLAPVEPGDILVSFSTHTFGWRHGHAGVVVDGLNGVTLEAVVMGSDSTRVNMWHWPTYSTFMILRVKDASPEERQAVSEYALAHLDGIPYHLTSGVFGAKAPPPEGNFGAQCAYLPWYAWQANGYDLDGDGGKIVTVADLAQSPLVEVVQLYGIDPRIIVPAGKE